MAKITDYYNFELQANVYLNSAHADKSPKLKYKGDYIVGEWYCKYINGGNSVVRIPKDTFLTYGRKFLSLIVENDKEFTDFLYSEYLKIISLSKKLEEMNRVDIKNKNYRDRGEFYGEYIEVFSSVIGFGYPLDMALEEYAKINNIDSNSILVPGESFLLEEERDLQIVSFEQDIETRNKMLEEHSFKYSYIFNNYSGYKPVNLDYFSSRLETVKDKIFQENNFIIKKPSSVVEWIGFSTYIRDVRKKCNMIANGMLDRYLKSECEKLNLSYEDAIFLTPEEFESNKNSHLKKFNNIRIVKASHDGLKDITEDEWDALVDDKDETNGAIKGAVASKGKVTGVVKIIMNPDEFYKMNDGDIIVTSMTRPEFAPILKKASAIVTNEGGITCHAAIISRELRIPCIIATGVATQVLKDGDTVEVDADNGVVRKI
jgi:phosphohistidine swiveling domain-containing protein